SKELWDLIETGVTVAAADATAEQQAAAAASRLRDRKVKNYLFQSIDRTILGDHSHTQYFKRDLGFHAQ
ncbi:retrovirus-related pol polyprotein from transposon TNT 1-94, partial [Trifolium medium]|nr:retrovirus-related pol polyprotein from transposon TNT 1-94 [Trifolium medium]